MSPATLLLAAGLALVLPGAGCNRDALARDTIDQVDALAAAITTTVRTADDKTRGVAAAQAQLDAERAALEAAVLRLKALRGAQLTDSVQAQWRDAFIDDLAAVESLQADLRVHTRRDPALAAALSRLVADYAAIVSAVPPPA